MNYLYDASGDKIATYRLMDNGNSYGVNFFADNSFPDTIFSIDAFDRYCKDMNFYTDKERLNEEESI